MIPAIRRPTATNCVAIQTASVAGGQQKNFACAAFEKNHRAAPRWRARRGQQIRSDAGMAKRRPHSRSVQVPRGEHRALDKPRRPTAEFKAKAVKCNERIAFKFEGDFLRMRLPSGRKLAYPFPRLFTKPDGECVVIYKDNQQGKWIDCHFGHGAYGGIWAENAVSSRKLSFQLQALSLRAEGRAVHPVRWMLRRQ